MDYSASSVATPNQLNASRVGIDSIPARVTFQIGGGSTGVPTTLVSQLNTGLSKGG